MLFAVGDTDGEFSLTCGVRREDGWGKSEEPDILVGPRIIIKTLCISLFLRCDGVLASFLAIEETSFCKCFKRQSADCFQAP